MLLWFAGLAVVGVFVVFRDAAVDYRLVALGAILPDIVDGAVFRGVGPFHTLTGAVVFLSAVMLGTIGRRQARRRLLALPIGVFAHLVLDGMWGDTKIFWWPFLGGSLDGRLPSLDRGALVLAQEVAGLAALAWCWNRFGLADPRRRSKFLRTGRLDRELV